MKQTSLFIGIMLYMHFTGYSQNLVANGSFEDANLCTEYQKYCAPEAWIATSRQADYYFADLSKAYDGYRYVALTAGSISKKGVRNFIRTPLLCGLRKGHQYIIEFYVSATNKILDSIGVYFSAEDFLYEKRSFAAIQPALWYVSSNNNMRPDSRNWQKVHFVYTATGEEGYMVIGSFKRTDYKGILRPDLQDEYVFLLDKVSVLPANANEKICAEAERQKVEIYNQNDRHTLIDKRISYYQKNPPAPRPNLSLTRIPYVQRIDTLVIPDIYFVSGSFELSPKSFALLDSFSHKLTGQMDSVVVKGHTDSIGNLDYNKELSLNRAVSVKQYLMSRMPSLGVNFIARGYAYSQPIASNRTNSGRRRNRRVEIFVYRKE